MTGFGQSATVVTARWKRLMVAYWRVRRIASEPPPPFVPVSCPNAFRSRPTVKCGPLAAITTARTSGSSPSSSMIRGMSCQKPGPMALRRSGLSSQSVAT